MAILRRVLGQSQHCLTCLPLEPRQEGAQTNMGSYCRDVPERQPETIASS